MNNPFKLLNDNLDIPVSYMTHSGNVNPPYIVYGGEGSTNFIADEIVYDSDYRYRIEYYFNYKDEKLEKEIEELLNKDEIVWSKSGDIYIDAEKMFVIHYQI